MKFGLIIIGLVLMISIVSSGCAKEGVVVENVSMTAAPGLTVEERLNYRNIDTTNAIITKIEDVSILQEKYSALAENAEVGHYIVELPNKIIMYDFEQDEIISEFSFQRLNIGELQS